MYRNCNPKRCVRVFWIGLAVVVATFTLIMMASRGCRPEDVTQPTVELREQMEEEEQQEQIEESLPLPEKQDKPQGELEITKLNPDSQIKERW